MATPSKSGDVASMDQFEAFCSGVMDSALMQGYATP
jgi:hypothetical protein